MSTHKPGPSTGRQRESSAEVLDRADRVLFGHAGPFARSVFGDLVVERASGTTVVDRDGRTYLDFTSGQLCATFGHNPPELRRAIVEAFDRSALHINSYLVSTEVVDLASELLALLGPPLDRVTFLNTGSEATEVGLKAAKMASGRWEVVGLNRSYHGHTTGAASVTFLPRRRGTGPGPSGVHAIPAPYCFRCPIAAEPSSCGLACIDVGFDAVDAQRTGDLAAVIVEPVLSTGGIIELPDGYLAELSRAARERGAALVVDEAQTGLGRTGPMFAFEDQLAGSGCAGRPDVVGPDVVALSKSLGGGFPLSAVALSADIAGGAEDAGFRFLTSHMNEPSLALVGLAMLALARHHVQAGTATERGRQLRDGLAALTSEPGGHVIGDVRGRGLLLGVEFVAPDGSPAPDIARAVAEGCRRRGVLVQVVSDNNWRVAPPITVSEGEIGRALDVAAAALAEEMAS